VALALLLVSGIAPAQEAPSAFFLVASPRLTDRNFRETVVLIIQHAPMVSRGLIINRPLDTPLSRLTPGDESFEQAQDPVYFGGPVALPHLSFLFRARERPKHGIQVMDDLYLGEDPALLKDLLRSNTAGRPVRVYAGHAGWGPGQLQSEIESGGWFMAPATAEYIFHERPASIWGELVKKASLRSASAAALLHDERP
jgi:putative transcriptional regulator